VRGFERWEGIYKSGQSSGRLSEVSRKKKKIDFFIVVFIFVKKLIDLLLFLNSIYLCA
jgi:hypothetical protein